MTTGMKASTINPPTLNIYRKIQIVRRKGDKVTFEDKEGNTQSLTAADIGDVILAAVRLIYRVHCSQH